MTEDKIKKGLCPECDHPLIREEGCLHCMICGWSACEVS